MVKTILGKVVLTDDDNDEESIHLHNAMEAFTYLVQHHTIGEDDAQNRCPREFRFVELGAVDHDKKAEVGKVESIKTYHCFRTIDEDNELHAAEVSCCCDGCWDSQVVNGDYVNLCTKVKSGERAPPTTKSVLTEAQRARDAQEAWRDAFVHGVSILRECQPGDWVLVYYDVATRAYWNECSTSMTEPSWAISGMFKVAELASIPTLPAEETLTSHRSRKHDLEVDLFVANEVVAEREFIFPDIAICDRVGRRGRGRSYAT